MQGTQPGGRGIRARLLLFASALCLFASFATAPATARAAASGTLTMSPGVPSLAVGDQEAVTFNLNNAVDVHEVDVYVLYNPGVVKVIDADSGTPGTQILPGPFPGGGNVADNSAAGGTIQYGYVLPPGITASGSGTIATVRFQALAKGDAGLQWGTVQLVDGSFATSKPSTSGVSVVVGGVAVVATGTVAPTDTPVATGTPVATNTAAPTGTSAASASVSPTAVPSATAIRSATATGTPRATATARATASPRVTILQNSNQPTQTIDQKLGVAPATNQKSTLPSAGNNGPGTQWWRWTFFGAALMLGIAGWFFTFALHHSDRDVVLLDRHDRRRRRP